MNGRESSLEMGMALCVLRAIRTALRGGRRASLDVGKTNRHAAVRSSPIVILAICLFATASSAAAAPTPGRSAIVQALDGKPQCVAFRWDMDAKGKARAGIAIPVAVNGRPLWFQLDTGANTDVIYSTIADKAGWSQPGDHAFRPGTLRVGATTVRRPYVRVHRELDANTTQGALGLADMIGRVVVIDYVDQTFCLFDEPDAPDSVRDSATLSAVLRDGKLFLPVAVGGFRSDSVVFDTGSSQFPLVVDLKIWRELTGLSDPLTSPNRIEGSSWGKPVSYRGGPATHSMTVGDVELKTPIVFTQPSAPEVFSHLPFRLDGIVGNAPFEGGVVVIDLTERVAFGYAR